MLSSWFGLKGRLRRSSYVTAVFGWWLALALFVGLIEPFASFAELGARLDHVQDLASFAELGARLDHLQDPVALGSSVWTQAALVALLVGARWAYVSLSVRRLHDAGASGWWALAALAPATSTILFLALALMRGAADENRYGPDPRVDASAPATASVQVA